LGDGDETVSGERAAADMVEILIGRRACCHSCLFSRPAI
jgi:hypothetical protein